MTRLPRETVPISALQRALRRLTECLAAEMERPAGAPPDWSELEWRLAPAVASIHGIGPLLATAWRWEGPPDWVDFLHRQRAATLLRARRFSALIMRIGDDARREGLPLMLLKGAALDALGIYRAGERPMADLDLLTPAAESAAVARMLASLGYRETGATWKHRAFEPAGSGSGGASSSALGEHPDTPLKIDLHVRITERLPLTECDFSDLILAPRMAAGLQTYPSTVALMLHVLAHTAGAMVHRGLRLIQLHDIARIARRMTEDDWTALSRGHRRERRLWWIGAPLTAALRYFPAALPEELVRAIARAGPWPLRLASRRTLTDVSYSHVLVDPVPGILWTRSLPETLRYVASRIRPGPAQRAQFAVLARTGPWARDPRWYAQSHLRRILQWLATRPTRTETMQPVRAALACTGPLRRDV